MTPVSRDSQSPPPAAQPANTHLFSCRELTVHYGDTAALQDVSVEVRRGRVTALIGPSGCGKSTFLCCLNRMTDLTPGCQVKGRILLDGEDIRDAGRSVIELRRRVGMIFQDPTPFPMSVRRNLHLPLQEHGVRSKAEQADRAEAALKNVGLWDEVADRLDRSALELSGGQQQRLCIARAIALEPEVLLLDEPCSALDPLSSQVVEELLLKLRGDYSLVVVTHNLAQARRIADDVLVMWLRSRAGRLIESGTAREVFESPKDPDAAAYVRGQCG